MLLLFVLVVLAALIMLIAALQKQSQKLRQVAQSSLISYGTILILLLCGEAYFRFVYAESTGVFSLAHLNWLNRYYHLNSLAYRDREWQAEDLLGRTIITVIGDSFTAGHGINDPADRYSDLLAQALGESYAVINMGQPGTSTPEQLEALKTFQLASPEIVIWQYFLNDIQYAALRVSDLPPLEPIPEIAEDSYLFNYLYFRLTPPALEFQDWYYGLYDNPTIWDLHRQEIEALVAYVDSLNAELIVIIYPLMIDPVGSIPYVDRVAQTIEATGHHNVLKLFDAVASWPSEKPLIVSSRDAHPSVEFNRYVSEQLYELYFANGS
jgi:hypothetical protein